MDSLDLIKTIALSLRAKAPASAALGKYVVDAVEVVNRIVENVQNLTKDRDVDRLLALDAWRLVYLIIEDGRQGEGKMAEFNNLVRVLREIETLTSQNRQTPERKPSTPEPNRAKLRQKLEECMKRFKLKSFPEIRRRANELERKWCSVSRSSKLTSSIVDKSVKTAETATVSILSGSASGTGAIITNMQELQGNRGLRQSDTYNSNAGDPGIGYQVDDSNRENRNFTMFNSVTTITDGEFNVAQTISKNINIYNAPPATSSSVPIAPLPSLRHPSSLFTGQDTYLQEIRDYFTADPTDDRKMFLLHGMGGIGKTQICLKFVEQNNKSFSDIFWIDASSHNSIDLGLRQIAGMYNILPENSPSAEHTLQWMSCRQNWLLVFDNADGDYRVVEKCLPPGREGNILITSRNKALARLALHNCSIEVTGMGEDDSIDLLLKSAKLDNDMEGIKIKAKQVVSELGYIPLAIDQAGAYMQSCGSGLDDYLNIFIKHRAKLMSDPGFSGASDYQYSAYGTWEISIKMIKQRASQESGIQALAAESALVIQNMFAFFHCNNISAEILRKAAKNFMERKNEGTNGLPQSISLLDSRALFLTDKGEFDELSFQEGIRVLLSFALIMNHNGLYSIHPLVHAWSRDRISTEDQEYYWMKAKSVLACSIELNYYDDNHAYCSLIAPHIRTCNEHAAVFDLKYFDDEFARWALVFDRNGWWNDREKVLNEVIKEREARLGTEHPDTLSARANIASTYWNQGRWQEAEEQEVQVMEASKKKLGTDHPSTLAAMGNLASTYRNQGRWKEAEELEVEVMEVSKKKLGIEHPDTLNAMANLASTYWNQGRWQEAEEKFVQVMEARKERLGTDHPDTLSAMANLASTYSNQGRWQEAEELELGVMEARKEKLGTDHPDTLNAMANLASTYRKQGRWQEAEELFIQVIEVSKEKLGTDHPSTLNAMENLASTYRNQGRWQEAEELFIQVKEANNEKLGIDHPDTLSAMASLASTYWHQGRWQEVEELEEQVMETRKGKLGTDHPDTLTAMSNLATTYRKQGRWQEAEGLEIQVVEARKEKLGTDHPDMLTAMANLASTYRNQGRWQESEELEMQVMETSREKLGIDHPSTLTAMANLASTYRYQGRWREAEELEVQVIEASIEKLGMDHPDTITVMANLASTYWHQGRWKEAEEMFMQVMEARKERLGKEHPDTLTAMANLACTYWNQGRWQEAEELEVQVMKARKERLGTYHPDTLTAIGNLASTYWNQGRWQEAEEMELQVMEASIEKLSSYHPSTLTAMGNLASTYRNQGRWKEAEELEVQVMKASKEKLGTGHPSTLIAMANLASTCRNQGKWQEAEELEVEVMEASKEKLGTGHPSTLSAMGNLASTYRDQGRQQEAEELEVQVMKAEAWD